MVRATVWASVRQRARAGGESAWFRTELARVRAENSILVEQVESLARERAELQDELKHANAELGEMNEELQAQCPTPLAVPDAIVRDRREC